MCNRKRAEEVNRGEWWQSGRTGTANGLKRQSWAVTYDAQLNWWLPRGGSDRESDRLAWKTERGNRGLQEEGMRKIMWIIILINKWNQDNQGVAVRKRVNPKERGQGTTFGWCTSASVKVRCWCCGSAWQMSHRGDRLQGNRQHTQTHLHTFVHTFTDRWKCRNNPEVPFCSLVASSFTTLASSPFIAISRSTHLSEDSVQIRVDNLLWLH